MNAQTQHLHQPPYGAAASPATAPRLDLYAGIHKALRALMSDTLMRVGRLDTDDTAEVADTLGRVDALLVALRGHVAHEDTYLHPAIEARHPGASQRIRGEHVEHLENLTTLQAETTALRTLPTAPAAQRLYHQLALFVAENLEHMHVEETQHNALLWDAYSDAELAGIHQQIQASIEPAQKAALLPLMVASISPAERAAMLGGMQRQLPPEAMRGVLALIRPKLDDSAWAKLARALNLPQPAAA